MVIDALAKSRCPRTVPVGDALLSAYTDYQHERARLLGDEDGTDRVLVNLCHAPLGAAMTDDPSRQISARRQTSTSRNVDQECLGYRQYGENLNPMRRNAVRRAECPFELPWSATVLAARAVDAIADRETRDSQSNDRVKPPPAQQRVGQ